MNKLGKNKLFKASYRCARETCRYAGNSSKKMVRANTFYIYNDCKKNPRIREYVLTKYGR